MRVTIKIDSATPEEVFDLTAAFQQTSREYALPKQGKDAPTVTVFGQAMGWVSPALYSDHAQALLTAYDDRLADRLRSVKSTLLSQYGAMGSD